MICYLLYKLSEMRWFLVDRTIIENLNVVQLEVEVEEPPPNEANEFNPNEIDRDPLLLACYISSLLFQIVLLLKKW